MEHIIAITTWQHGDYAGFDGRELWKTESGESWNWKYYPDPEGPRYMLPTQGIILHCQGNLRPAETRSHQMYGFTVKLNYDVTISEIKQAEHDIARLKKIERGYQKLVNKFGTADSFAKFAAYIADVIGAELAEPNDVYGDHGYCSMDVNSLLWKEQKLLNPDRN